METDKKLETLEEELKLMKGEVKQSLASVRDYLLNMELPSSELATVLQALGNNGTQNIIMKGSLTSEAPAPSKPAEELEEPGEPAFEETREEFLEPEPELPLEEEESGNQDESFGNENEPEEYPEDNIMHQEEYFEPEVRPLSAAKHDEPDEQFTLEPELPREEWPMVQGQISNEMSQSTPKVNLLVNLMHWVTKTKKEIGSEQLPAFLEVYGLSGHLTPELKEAILHLVDVTSEQPEDTSSAEIWSQLMLSLHGILTGGDAPLHPVKPFWNDDESEIQPNEEEITELEEDQPKDTPFKLKLVFPGSDGKSQEFCLDLKPEVVNSGPREEPGSREHPNERGDVPCQPRRARKGK